MAIDGVKVGVKEISPIIEETLREGNNVRLIVTGSSMYPLLTPERDSVVIRPATSVKKGDLALFKRSNGLIVLHRVAKVKKAGFYCVGDNQTRLEGPLSDDQILGVATTLIRDGKEISENSRTYRLYALVWLTLRPIRRAVVAVLRKIKRIFKGKRNEKVE